MSCEPGGLRCPSCRDGQGRLLHDTSLGVTQAAREKRESLAARVERARELLTEDDPCAHFLLWHDLEAEEVPA